jgi:formylmethanofuran dehydrogenase subunit E
MLRVLRVWMAVASSWLVVVPARAHELWFQPLVGNAAVARLTFGDSPAPGEAERVAEIAHARVWGDGVPLEIRRRPDGLEVRLPTPRPSVLSAAADRGVVDYMGDSFVIMLAAYVQQRPVKPDDALKLGLDDDQLRLLLVARDHGPPVVRARWRGQPVADAIVRVFRGTGEPTELRTDHQGEMPCPDLREGPVALLAQVVDKTPGRRDGKDYSEVRYKATLTIGADAAGVPSGSAFEECLNRVREVHGAAGPWAVAGYRIGERALKELKLPRHSASLLVIHHCPAQVQYSCIADGLQAATGASPGKLNLRVEEASVDDLKTIVQDRRTGRRLTFTLKPVFARSIANLPQDRLEAEGRRVASLPDDAVFEIKESNE